MPDQPQGITKRPPGRPPKIPGQRKRSILALRIRDEMKDALTQRAKDHQRSLSEEAEALLDGALRARTVLGEGLDLAFGHQAAGLVLLLARVMVNAEATAALVATKAAGRSPATALDGGSDWMSQPYVVEQVGEAVGTIFKVLKAVAEAKATLDPGLCPLSLIPDLPENRSLGVNHAYGTLHFLVNDRPDGRPTRWAEPIRERIGPELAERIKAALEASATSQPS